MKRKWLKAFATLVCLTMFAGIAACGGAGNNTDENGNESSEITNSGIDNEEILVGTEGVVYQLVADGKYAMATGYNGAATEVVIASRYQGIPVKYVGSFFGEQSDLRKIVIPDSVTNIYQSAFSYCERLTSVEFGNNSQLTNISGNAFYYCGSLNEIVIPDSVTSIGERAFMNCLGLTEIAIPNGVSSIGSGAFNGCDNLQYVVKDGLKYLGNEVNPYIYLVDTETTDIKTATIENGCKIIANSAFHGCEKLTKIVIPDTVTSVGSYAFHYCLALEYNEKNGLKYLGNGDNKYLCLIEVNGTLVKQLTSVSIEDGCKAIADYAFSRCDNLTSVVIPASVMSIGNKAFAGCAKLTSITVDKNNTQYKDVDGNLYSKDGQRFICYAIGKTDTIFSLPDGVVELNMEELLVSSAVEELVLPDSAVVFHGTMASLPPTNLSILTAPAVMAAWINNYTNVLQRLTVTSGEITWRINNCNELVISDKVTYVAEGAIGLVQNITVSQGNSAYQSINGNLYTKDGKTLIKYGLKNTTGLVESVTRIAAGAFALNFSLTEIVIPDNVTSIGGGAFYNCRNLTIYCEAESQPSDWDSDWNYSNCPVYWYSESKPTTDGNYWHYGENGEMEVW